jgi:hypothetical protein
VRLRVGGRTPACARDGLTGCRWSDRRKQLGHLADEAASSVLTTGATIPGEVFNGTAHTGDQPGSRRVGGWRGGDWFGCRSGRSCLGFPPGSFRFDRGRYRFRFQPPPVKPCMRFSRTRLTDVLHRRRSAFQARNGLGGTTIPSRLIRPRWLGELSTWVIPQPQARRRLPRLDSHSASRVKA